ncbi:MAG: ABC transporter permease, partial [Treponema sp.]|nr:ABC transporter permease [Treponema sp.]
GQFIVAGIVQDSTIFGYFKVYISRLSLNRLLLFEDDDCSLIGLFENSSDLEKNRSIIHNAMSGKIQTDRLVYDRDGMNDVLKEPWKWEGTNLMLFTLPVYLSEIASLMNAMDLLSYLLYGMMLIIILVSASVTYRLILHERTREMGVMRAIGFYGSDLRMVLWTEITILGIISIIAGFMLSLLFSFASSFISFSWFPSFEIFLRNGKLTALYLPGTVLFNIVITLLVLIISVFIPSMRASNKNLPSLLSGEPL